MNKAFISPNHHRLHGWSLTFCVCFLSVNMIDCLFAWFNGWIFLHLLTINIIIRVTMFFLWTGPKANVLFFLLFHAFQRFALILIFQHKLPSTTPSLYYVHTLFLLPIDTSTHLQHCRACQHVLFFIVQKTFIQTLLHHYSIISTGLLVWIKRNFPLFFYLWPLKVPKILVP